MISFYDYGQVQDNYSHDFYSISYEGSSQCIKKNKINKNNISRASLVAQWLRIRLPMQGTWVRALV